MVRFSSLLLLLVALGGCGDDGSTPMDAGSTEMDGGSTELDGGTGSDAGTDTDGGTTPTDAGTDAGPLRAFGEACADSSQCEGGVCLGPTGGSEGTCTRTCDPDVPHDCRDVGRLCLALGTGSRSVCAGPEIETGADTEDDAIIAFGDCITRTLSPLGDADLIRVKADFTGMLNVGVEPLNAGVDVGFLVYDGAGALQANINANGPGERDGITFTAWTPDSVAFLLVQDAGSSVSGQYRICNQAL